VQDLQRLITDAVPQVSTCNEFFDSSHSKRIDSEQHINEVLAMYSSALSIISGRINNVARTFATVQKKRPRVVILGSGWGGNTLARRIRKDLYDVRLISPANHFLFTPLLPSTAVGTLEFRAIQEPVRTIAGLGEYYQAKATALDTRNQLVKCRDLFKGHEFAVKYDYLCISAGNKTNTFNTPGIAEREGKEVFYLKHLHHARQIRNRVLECFERASNPSISPNERDRLVSFIVVGGGPTSCEFTSELYDFLQEDVKKWYPDLTEHIKLTLVEAGPGLLGTFQKSLADYYLDKLRQKNIDVRLSTAVTGVEERWYPSEATSGDFGEENHHYTVASFADGTELPFGAMVWSAGLAPVRFVEEANLELSRGNILVDKYLRVPGQKGRILALGDCSTFAEGEGLPLPPTASVAEQQATYICDCFNLYYKDFDVLDEKTKDKDVPIPGPVVPALMPWRQAEFLNKILVSPAPEFQYKNRGALAAMGFGGGISDLTKTDLPAPKIATSGLAAFFMWRSAYWTKQLSWSNMILIPMYWFKQMIFGRDICRF
jgi:NADH dehydrogenase/NADH:ubiquinone reductase (non-electrogenic)